MIFKSKRTIAGVAVAVILFIGYVVYATGSNAPLTDDLEGWALLILKFILVCVIAEIIVYVAAHVLLTMSVTAKEGDKAAKKIVESETADDEMDKNITLRSSHIGYGIAGVGFIIMLIAVAFLGVSAAMALNILLGIFFLSAMTEACVSIYLYEIGDNRFKCDRDG